MSTPPLEQDPIPAFRDLQRLLRPAVVALVGASPEPRSLGGRTLANLRTFGGRLHLVNPNRNDIDGRPCWPTVGQVPERVDCVVLAIPREGVEAAVADCARAGVGAVVILSSGFAELEDEAGRTAQLQLAALASAAGMRLVGPNCVGVAHHAESLCAAFAEFPRPRLVPGRRIGLVSQSGAIGMNLSHAAERGVAVSHVLSCGNSCDVDVADFVAHLAEDAGCDAIALAFEGLERPQRLLQAVRRASACGKPVAFCKLGLSESGRSAVRWHTATDPGSAQVWAGLEHIPGVVRVTGIESLMETAVFLSKAPPPLAVGLAVVSGSGGTAILALDAAARAGVPTPQPADATVLRLRAALPAFASPRNPCDATAQATRHPQLLLDAAEALLEDPAFGCLAIPWGRSQSLELLPALGRLGQRCGKPVCLVWMSQSWNLDAIARIESESCLSFFQSLDGCMQALAAWGRAPRAAT